MYLHFILIVHLGKYLLVLTRRLCSRRMVWYIQTKMEEGKMLYTYMLPAIIVFLNSLRQE